MTAKECFYKILEGAWKVDWMTEEEWENNYFPIVKQHIDIEEGIKSFEDSRGMGISDEQLIAISIGMIKSQNSNHDWIDDLFRKLRNR